VFGIFARFAREKGVRRTRARVRKIHKRNMLANEVFVVVENIRSAENVGSLFRTADALGIQKIFLCGITPIPISIGRKPGTDKIAKTALGAEQTVAWEYASQTWRVAEQLKRKGVRVVALEQSPKSIALQKFEPKFPLALALGNEVNGVSSAVLKRCDNVVEIPMRGQKESLNVAVAFGIAAYQIVKHESP